MPAEDDPAKVIKECKAALVNASKGEKARLFVRMADAYKAMKKGNRALVCYHEAFDAGNTDPDFILKYVQQLSDSGKSDQALAVTRKALDMTADPVAKARLNSKGAHIARLIGQFDDGIKMGKRALDMASRMSVNDPVVKGLKAEANTAIAQNLWRQGNLAAARGHLESALDIYTETGNTKGVADACSLLGIVTSLMGDQERALAYHERSRQADDKARCYINIGIIKQMLGDFDGAEESLKVALKKGREEDYKIAIHLAQLNLAEVNLDRANITKARTWIDLSLKGYEEMPENPRIALVFNAMAEIVLLEGDVDEAESIAGKGRAIAEDKGLKDATARLYRTIGLIARARGDLQRAKELLERSAALMEQIDLVRYIGKVYIDLALVCRDLGLDQEQKRAVEEARKVLTGQDARFQFERMKRLGL